MPKRTFETIGNQKLILNTTEIGRKNTEKR